MRAVVQRVAWAKVEIAGEVTGAIEKGLLVYLGAGKGDVDADRAYVLAKTLGLRIFGNEEGKMDKSVVDVGCGVGRETVELARSLPAHLLARTYGKQPTLGVH